MGEFSALPPLHQRETPSSIAFDDAAIGRLAHDRNRD
jgi:hypothetical protein